MAIKHQGTNITVVKHQGTTLTTVYHQGTKVFPDQTYQQLDTWVGFDSQEQEFYFGVDNPNSFSVSINCEVYWETSTGDNSDEFTVSVGAGVEEYFYFGYTIAEEVYYASIYLTITGGGYTWTQSDEYDNY